LYDVGPGERSVKRAELSVQTDSSRADDDAGGV